MGLSSGGRLAVFVDPLGYPVGSGRAGMVGFGARRGFRGVGVSRVTVTVRGPFQRRTGGAPAGGSGVGGHGFTYRWFGKAIVRRVSCFGENWRDTGLSDEGWWVNPRDARIHPPYGWLFG